MTKQLVEYSMMLQNKTTNKVLIGLIVIMILIAAILLWRLRQLSNLSGLAQRQVIELTDSLKVLSTRTNPITNQTITVAQKAAIETPSVQDTARRWMPILRGRTVESVSRVNFLGRADSVEQFGLWRDSVLQIHDTLSATVVDVRVRRNGQYNLRVEPLPQTITVATVVDKVDGQFIPRTVVEAPGTVTQIASYTAPRIPLQNYNAISIGAVGSYDNGSIVFGPAVDITKTISRVRLSARAGALVDGQTIQPMAQIYLGIALK